MKVKRPKQRCNMVVKLIITLCLFLNTQVLRAQDKAFILAGRVEYEKTVNMKPIINQLMDKSNKDVVIQTTLEQYASVNPQFKKFKSTLVFNNGKSLFTPNNNDKNVADPFQALNEIADQPNLVFTDQSKRKEIVQKNMFESTFLLVNDNNNINWKLTFETRNILGFTCRRVDAIILDSIYVVAFYTDRIPMDSGPETFGRAPGLLLQVTLPHEHISWVATKIETELLQKTNLIPPTTGTPIKAGDIKKNLSSIIKETSIYFPIYLKVFSW